MHIFIQQLIYCRSNLVNGIFSSVFKLLSINRSLYLMFWIPIINTDCSYCLNTIKGISKFQWSLHRQLLTSRSCLNDAMHELTSKKMATGKCCGQTKALAFGILTYYDECISPNILFFIHNNFAFSSSKIEFIKGISVIGHGNSLKVSCNTLYGQR